jgi:hypothetical protein
MVVDDSQVSNVRKLGGGKHCKGPFSLQNTFGVNDFLQKTFNQKIGKFSYKCAYLE